MMAICSTSIPYIVLLFLYTATYIYGDNNIVTLQLQHTDHKYITHTVGNISHTHRAYHTQQLTNIDSVLYNNNNPIQLKSTTPSSVVLTGCPSRTFWTAVQIGTDTFNLIIDTGSATTAVAGSNCPSCPSAITPVYNSKSSGSANTIQITITSTYGDGSSWVGTVHSDIVTLDSVSGRLNFAVMHEQSNFFPSTFCSDSSSIYQGILGLGYDSLLLAGTTSFNDIITNHASTMSTVFSMQLCSASGKLWLGGSDMKYFNSYVQWIPVIHESYFTVELNDVMYDNKSIGYSSSDYGTVIVDSGSASFILPTNIYNNFIDIIQSNNKFQLYFSNTFFTTTASDGSQQCVQSRNNVDMNTLNNNLPSLQLKLSSNTILTLQPINSYLLQYISNGVTYYCPGLRPYDTKNTKKTIFGYSILNQYITVFDTQNALIGFASTQSCTAGTNNQYDTISYEYVAGGYSDCSESCIIGGGQQTRHVVCKSTSTQTVNDSYCSGQTKPSTSIQCNTCPLSAAVAIGLIAGCSVAVAIILLITVVWCCRRESNKSSIIQSNKQQQHIVPLPIIHPVTPTNIYTASSNYTGNDSYNTLYTPSSTIKSTSMFNNNNNRSVTDRPLSNQSYTTSTDSSNNSNVYMHTPDHNTVSDMYETPAATTYNHTPPAIPRRPRSQ